MATKHKNYYEILKVSPLASPQAIKTAYRKLARLYHPDKNKNNQEATTLFKQIHQAYQELSDPFKRKAFDQKIKKEKEKAQKKQQHFSPMYDSFHTYPSNEGGGHFPTGDKTAPPHTPHPSPEPKKGVRPLNVLLPISLETAILGGQKTVTLNIQKNGTVQKQVVKVSLPPGAREKQVIKVNSSLHASLVYEEHPLFTVDGDHIRMDLPVPWTKAILGGEVRVPTPRGEVSFQLPAGTHGGHVIQLKGQGFPLPHSKQRGHMLITIVIDIPSDFSLEEKKWIANLQNKQTLCPRVVEFDIKAKRLLKNRKQKL